MRYLLVLSLVFVFLLSEIDTNCQDQRIADSLSRIYYSNIQLNDSSYLELLYDLSYYQSNPDTALKFSNKLIDFATQKSNSRYIYRGLLQKGNALRLKGELEQAAQIFFDCATEAKKFNYERGVGCAYVALGDIYLSSYDHKNSLNYYFKALDIFQKIKDSSLLANTTFNIGSEYLNVEQLDTALFYFDISETIYEKLNNQSGIAYNAGNKGLVYARLKKYKQAETNLIKAIHLLKSQGDIYALTSYQIELSRILEKNGDLNKAIKYALESYKAASENNLMPQVRDASFRLSELYEVSGDYRNALKFQAEYISFKDSIINREKLLQIADLRTAYEVAQKQIEVDLLEKTRNIISVALAVIIILSIAIVCILLLNNSRNKNINKKLAEQKEELETQRDLLAEQKEELETQRDELTELNHTKDRFFSIISHDLRGPISTLHGFSIILKEYIENKNYKELYDLNEELNITVNKVSSLLDNLLDWALSQQGRFPYSPANLKLQTIIDEIVMTCSPMALAKNINIINEVETKLEVWADKNSLMTVLRNLINNAIKFSHNGSSIEVKASKSNKFAEIRILDYGVGIPEEKLTDLFKLKGDKSTWGTAREKGTGLGLSLAYDFITMNRGTIDVESKVNKGTTFIVKIPVSKLYL